MEDGGWGKMEEERERKVNLYRNGSWLCSRMSKGLILTIARTAFTGPGPPSAHVQSWNPGILSSSCSIKEFIPNYYYLLY